MNPTKLSIARNVRVALTERRVDLLLGTKSEIENIIAAELPEIPSNSLPPAKALARLVSFACDNQESSTGIFIRDFLRSVHAGGGLVELRPLHHIDDSLARAFITVQTAFFICEQPRSSRLFAEYILPEFKKLGAEEFFFAATHV